MAINFKKINTSLKNIPGKVEDAFKSNPLESAYNKLRGDSASNNNSLPEPGNTIGDFFVPRDNSLNEGYDDWERLIDYNVTDKEVLNPLIGDVPNDQLLYLANTATKFNLNTELSSLVQGALTTDPPQSFGRIIDLNKRKFVYGINDYVNMPSDSMYSDVVDKIEDPTILSFTLEIDEDNSPLFKDDDSQLGSFLNTQRSLHNNFENSLEKTNTALKLNNPFEESMVAWTQLKDIIRKFFKSFDTDANTADNKSKSHYIKEIGNVEVLDKVWTGKESNDGFEFDYITVKLTEDVKLSVRNLALMYNTFKFHKASGKQLVPENLLRFNMWVKLSEIRNFTSLRQYIKANDNARDVIRAIRKDVSALYYYMEDCEFDFDTVHSKDQGVSYSAERPTEYETLTFKIKFRRAHRLFKPTLLNATIDDNGYIYHIDERGDNAFVTHKYYTQESPLETESNLKNVNLPFNSLMVGRKEEVFSSVSKTARKRTLVPDGIVRGSALFRDKFNQNTKDQAPSKTDNSKAGGFWNKAANVAFDVAEAYLESEVGSSIRGLKDTYAQKLIRATNSTLTRLRNNLVKNLKNKIHNEGLGVPSPSNIYAPTNSNQEINQVLNEASRLTGVNFTSIRNSQEVQTLNPSLQGRPINIGNLQSGFYNQYPLNPNDYEQLNDIDLASTTNYTNGKINISGHSTYQKIMQSSGLDLIVDRESPSGNVNKAIKKKDSTALGNLNPVVEKTQSPNNLGDRHPNVDKSTSTNDLGNLNPDVEPVEQVNDLGDRHPDAKPAEQVNDLGDRHPDIDNDIDTDLLNNVNG